MQYSLGGPTKYCPECPGVPESARELVRPPGDTQYSIN